VKSKLYMGKFDLIGFLVIVGALIIGIIVTLIVEESPAPGVATLSVGIIIVVALAFTRRDFLLGYCIVDDKGIAIFFGSEVKKQIDWQEIKEVNVFFSNREDARPYKFFQHYSNYFSHDRAEKFSNYLILAKDSLDDSPYYSLNNCICLGRNDLKIYAMLALHLDKIDEELSKKIKGFFGARV